MAYNCGCDYTNAPNIILPRAPGDSLFTVGNPLDVPCTNGCGGVCHLEQYISFVTASQSYWSFRLKSGGNACVNNNNQSPCAEGEIYAYRFSVLITGCFGVEAGCFGEGDGTDLYLGNWTPVPEGGLSAIAPFGCHPPTNTETGEDFPLCEDEGTQLVCNPSGVTTTNNPNANGEVNYNFCYCPLSFCELAALELGDSFSGGVYGSGAIAGENDADAEWNRSGNTWTASFTMPCGMTGTMTMECDDASSAFNFGATSSCCSSMTITPPSSNSVEKPPNFMASSPVSNCDCPPECCHEGDCGWTSGGTTQNPNLTTQNPNENTTEDPNATTQNPNGTTQNPNGTTQSPVTTQDPNAPTTCPPGRFGWALIGGQPCFSCSSDPYCFTGSETVYSTCVECYTAANGLNSGRTYENQACDTIFDPIDMCN